MDKLKQAACTAIENASEELYKLSNEIWCNPELGYEEYHAHKVLTDILERKGFTVFRKYKIETAFRAEIGSTEHGPHIAVICEYDALPEIGHACGHNLIAEVGVAAGLGIQAAFKANGTPMGKLSVIGTPAEEGKGGKIVLLKEHVFDGIDVAMMSHPTPSDDLSPIIIARERMTVRYTGKAAHAAASPWEGLNALDSAVLCYQGISCLRQQIRPTWRIHAIISKGGDAPNVIPESTELQVYIGTPTSRELKQANDRITACFESAALMTGCKVEYFSHGDAYLNLITNKSLANVYKSNAKYLGLEYPPTDHTQYISTDMGNVSYEVPSIHPHFYCGTDSVNHTREFTAAVGDVKAQPYTLTQGMIMAMTCIDIFTTSDLLQTIKDEFNAVVKDV